MNMRELFLNRITLVWFALVGATVLSFQMGSGLAFSDLRYAGGAILIVSFIKVRFVIAEFMELRQAPFVMRLIADLWTVAACALLVTLFLAPSA